MQRVLAIAAIALGLGMFNHPTYADGYVVNGHAASPTEVQLLASYGARPGQWVVDGYGISPAVEKAEARTSTGNDTRKCWYVLDVLLCE
jgi:hypothetical protein